MPFPKLPGIMARAFSRFQLRSFRRGGGSRTRGGVETLILHTVGARSGEPRSAALGYLQDGPDSWLVVASLAGAARHPGWLYNLAKRSEAEIELADGRRVAVAASTLEGPELEAAWERYRVEAPEYAAYLSRTDKEMPIVRLRARVASADR